VVTRTPSYYPGLLRRMQLLVEHHNPGHARIAEKTRRRTDGLGHWTVSRYAGDGMIPWDDRLTSIGSYVATDQGMETCA
jgi:hypothetical protein